MSRRDATRKAEILARARQGDTPRMIAQALHLSQRTVYWHLGGSHVQARKRRSDAGRRRI